MRVTLTNVVHKRFKYWVTGSMFLPARGTLHYQLLQLQFYEQNFVDILRVLKNESADE